MAPNNPTAEHRRPLSFPAVRPCAAISPATLLASLITLTQTISAQFHPDSLATQRRNAAEAMRQINILLVLFQELHDGAAFAVPQPCLADLHVTLQKIRFLMHDCARDGARLLMLAKSRHVASLFHLLIRAVAASLDTLPLRGIDITGEVKEMAELLTKQGKRAKLEFHQNDERETKRLRLVLDQLERGVEPHVETIKAVLHYVGIKSWSVCNNEVKFLEEELGYSDEVTLLSALIGFLCYSRVVIFENSDYLQCGTTTEESEEDHDMETLTCVVPEDFRCPISLEIMTDPVTISTGQTYNRDSITKWFKQGNMICPKTRERVTNTELFPNAALKKLIQQFCWKNGVTYGNSTNPNPNHRTGIRTSEAGSPAAAHAMQFLSWFISRRLVFGTEEQKNKAAYEIRLLAKSNVFNRVCLVEMGTVGPLLDLLATEETTAQDNAINALMKLAMHKSGLQVIVESRGLVPIVHVLKRGLSPESRHVAAVIIFYLSSVKEYRKLMGEKNEVIPALVEMVKEGTISEKRNAVVAIFGLLFRRKNHPKVLAAGAVPALVNILASSSSDKRDLVTDSLAVLVALVEKVEGARAAFRAKALPLVTGILQSTTSRAGKEYCASILLALCVNVGAEVTGVVAKDASIMPSLYKLITDGTPHAAKKARSLIKVVLDFSEKSYSHEKNVKPLPMLTNRASMTWWGC